MKIKTVGSRIQIEVDEQSVGGLVLDSLSTAVEVGTVVGIGKEVTLDLKKGDKVMYKSWAVDICTFDGKRYMFIDESTKGICAVIEK